MDLAGFEPYTLRSQVQHSNITPQKTAQWLNITHLTIARLMNDNVNKVKNIIYYIIINVIYQFK